MHFFCNDREASYAIRDMPLLLLQPFVELGVMMLVTGMQCVLLLYIYTSSVPDIDKSTGVTQWPQDDFTFYMQWYFYFGAFPTKQDLVLKP